jgi:hypothetical protein
MILSPDKTLPDSERRDGAAVPPRKTAARTIDVPASIKPAIRTALIASCGWPVDAPAPARGKRVRDLDGKR